MVTLADFNARYPTSFLSDPAKTGPGLLAARNILSSPSFQAGIAGTAPLPKALEGGFSKEVLAGAQQFAGIKQAELEAKKKEGGFFGRLKGAAPSLPLLFAPLSVMGGPGFLGSASTATSPSALGASLGALGQSGLSGLAQQLNPFSTGATTGTPLPPELAEFVGPATRAASLLDLPTELFEFLPAAQIAANLPNNLINLMADAGLTAQQVAEIAIKTPNGLMDVSNIDTLVSSGQLTAAEGAAAKAAAAAKGTSKLGILDLLKVASAGIGVASGITSLASKTPQVGGAGGGGVAPTGLTSPSFGVQFGATPSLQRTGGQDPAAIEQAQRAALGDIGAGFAGLRGQIPGLQEQLLGQPFGDIQAGTRRLRDQVTATGEELGGQFNKIREARLQELGNVRDRTVGNLRDTLRQRRVFGSGFASADIQRAEMGFQQEQDRILAESGLQEAAIRGDFQRLAGGLLELDQRTLQQQTQNIATQAGLSEQEGNLLVQQMSTIQAQQNSLAQTLTREFQELTIPGNLANGVAALVNDVGKTNAQLALTSSLLKGEALSALSRGLGTIGSIFSPEKETA